MAKRAGKENLGLGPKDAEIGDNSGDLVEQAVVAQEAVLTEAEKREVLYRARKAAIVNVKAEKVALQAALKNVGKRLSAARLKFKHDIGIKLEDFDHIQAITELKRAERTQSVKDLNWMAEIEGLSPGAQMSMYEAFQQAEANAPEAVRSAQDWYRDGQVAYNRNSERKPPEGCPPDEIQNWIEGFDAEMERVAWAMASIKIVDRDVAKDNWPAPTISDEPEDDEQGSDEPVIDDDLGPKVCDTCGGDGSLLPIDIEVCPSCDVAYETV